MDNSKSINLIKEILNKNGSNLESISMDDSLKLYIDQRLNDCKVKVENTCDMPYNENINDLKDELKHLKKELKHKAEEAIAVKNERKRKAAIKEFCPKIKKLESKIQSLEEDNLVSYIYDRIKMLNTNVQFGNHTYGLCNGLKANLPFLINMFFELMDGMIKEGFIGTINKEVILNVADKFTKNNQYKSTFESFFNDPILINYISKKKCDTEVNPNTISLLTLFEISKLNNIEEFTIEKFVDIINRLKSETSSDTSFNKDDQTVVVNSFGEPFYEDKYVRIFRAYTKEMAILYGQGYHFCVSSNTGYNYFNKYRFAKMSSCGYETTLHFVFFKNKDFQNKSGMYGSGVDEGIFDKWNACIIDLCWDDDKKRNHIWYYTSSDNDGTHKTDPEGIKKYVKELINYPIKKLGTSSLKYNNKIDDALENGGFETKEYSKEELLMKDYSADIGNSDEITLNMTFKKKKTTLKDVLDGDMGRIFAEILMANMAEYNLSKEVIKYIYDKFDKSKLGGDSIVGRTRYGYYHAEMDLNVAIAALNNVVKIEEAIGLISEDSDNCNGISEDEEENEEMIADPKD